MKSYKGLCTHCRKWKTNLTFVSEEIRICEDCIDKIKTFDEEIERETSQITHNKGADNS
jgi:hypothetical protein